MRLGSTFPNPQADYNSLILSCFRPQRDFSLETTFPTRSCTTSCSIDPP